MARAAAGTLVGIASVGGHPRPAGARRLLRQQGRGDQLLREPARRTAVHRACKVVTICPGYIDTPLTRQQPLCHALPDAAGDVRRARLPRHRRGASSYRVIPWQMGVVAKLLRLLPNALFDRLLAGRPRKHRQGA